jgi:uncharacterized protein YjbI with pentapeptide repeats/tetratricopeptide (TPR) repeat protein
VITTEDVGYATVSSVVWQRCLGVARWIIGRDWRRVFTLALGVLAFGLLLVIVTGDQIWDEVGTGLIGGSVVGLVFAIAQHTLDLQAVERQLAHEVRLTVSSTGDLEGIDLAGSDLSAVHLLRKRLRYAQLDGARLVGADLRASDLAYASLRRADLRRADLRDSSLAFAVLDGADLSGAEIPAGGLSNARLVGAALAGARLVGAGPADAGSGTGGGDGDDRGADGGSCRVDLSGATLDDARLSRVALPEVRASFLSARRADVTGGVLRRGDLSCADLRGASLSGADLRDADLSGADLRGTVMSRADLRGARLVGARLERADLTGAIVAGADLRAADLQGAYLTNVDLAATRMDGARVRAEDLAPAESRPDAATRGLQVDPAGGAGADVDLDVLALVAPAELRDLAAATAARLRARRAGLERVNGDLDAIHLREETPYAGEAADHGLPRSVVVRRRPPRRRTRAWVELRPIDTTDPGPGGGVAAVQVVVHLPGRGARAAGRVSWPDGGGGAGGVGGVEWLASAIQIELADPEVFATTDELHAFATWLERPGSPPAAMLAEVLGRNPRNPVALLMRAFARESSDVHDMTEASDEVRAAWAVSRSDTARALAAARLAWAQGQVLFRASDSDAVLARARSAADTALGLFHHLQTGRRPSSRLLVLRTKGELAWALSRSVTERSDDLAAGIACIRRSVHALEQRGLAGTPRLRNALAYWLMTLAGRFTPGPGAGYTEAIAQLRQLLAHYRLREEMDLVDDATRRTTVSVRTLARRAAAGKGPPADRLLWERSLRLGLVNLGNLHRLEKRFDAALDCYGAAIYCSPDYVEAYAERAWVHLERADRAAADADIRRALARDVGTPQQKARILIDYVEALERVGLEVEQGPWLEEVRRRDPDNARLEGLVRRWDERFGDSA